MRTFKTLGIAGGLVAAALVGGTLINAALAAPAATSTRNGAPATTADMGKYCETWQQTFADELGVSVDDLVPAAKAATISTIDAAVAAGDLPSDVADRMKAAIDKADGDGCRLLGAAFHGFGRHAAGMELGVDLVGAAADALGMQKDALITALRSGDSLKQIATDQGKDYAVVSKAVHDAAKANLDALVSAGKMDQAREDSLLSRLDEALASGEFPRHGPGHGGHFGFLGLHPMDGPADEAPPAS
jgi:hypothetical protein